MACCNGGGPPPDGWRMIPEQRWATETPIATSAAPPAAQPGRAPASSSPAWWVWGLVAVLVLVSLRAK